MNAQAKTGLTVDSLTVRRGDISVCHDVSLHVPHGEITVLLGANGAGKTTLLDGITGVLMKSTNGKIWLGKRPIESLPVHRRARQGLAYLQQGRGIFRNLTVTQNIKAVTNSPQELRKAFALFPELERRRYTQAGLLSGGEQQMLKIARALTTQPEILLIDELSLGLAPKIAQSMMATLQDLSDTGVGILLVEQYARMSLEVGTTAHILRGGRIVLTESCASLKADPRALLSQHYLGSEA